MSSTLINSVANTTLHRDRDVLDQSVARLLLEFLDAEAVTIYRLVDIEGVKRVMRSVGLVRGQAEVVPEVAGDPAHLPAVGDLPAWAACASAHEVARYTLPGGNECTVFPIEKERDVTGLLAVEAIRGFSPRDVRLVIGILRVLKNHLAVLDYGERDTLTGMLNRKTFEASFGKLRLRIRQADNVPGGSEPSWLGLADIDNFKSINDNFGHLFGDEVLLLTAQMMSQCFRGADALFRFGGEEFVVVLEHSTAAGAAIAFDRFRATIEAHEFPQVGRVTISLGYTQIDSQDGPSTCVERADAALYYAKRNGRNNVRSHELLIAGGELAKKQSGDDDVELF